MNKTHRALAKRLRVERAARREARLADHRRRHRQLPQLIERVGLLVWLFDGKVDVGTGGTRPHEILLVALPAILKPNLDLSIGAANLGGKLIALLDARELTSHERRLQKVLCRIRRRPTLRPSLLVCERYIWSRAFVVCERYVWSRAFERVWRCRRVGEAPGGLEESESVGAS